MGIFSPSFLLGLVTLFYLSSFVFFAVVRIATGISIQRLGYLSLRRIAYTPRDGVRIDLRGLGLHLHRPTFARPTWLSLRLTELKVTVDLRGLSGGNDAQDIQNGGDADGPSCVLDQETPKPSKSRSGPARSQTWKRLTQLKEKIKRLHEKIHWICMVDVEVLNASCVITDIASVQIGSFTMAVDTRRKTVDRGRLFRHKKASAGEQRPAEWVFVIKSVFFTPEAKDSQEIIDICSLNVHGLLYRDLVGLRDASISLKLGRIHIPYDDFLICQNRIKHCQSVYSSQDIKYQDQDISLTDVVEELNMPGSREENIVQTVSDSKEFISSLLRGIQEIQMAVSFIGLSKEIRTNQSVGQHLYLNFAMNEFGIDLYRLDPKSPAHRMYFSPKDIAHQALLAAISIAVSVDDGGGKPERLLYIPMATTTVKTTLPCRTVADSTDEDVVARNANILFANLVVTSPSIDLDLNHTKIVLALFQAHTTQTKPDKMGDHRHHLISRLLPKANIKLSIQEPVMRVVIPPMDTTLTGIDEYDMLISSISSISFDMDSSHSAVGNLHYALTSNIRVSSHQLYYQSANGDRHNLLLTDALELKGQISATPEVLVVVSGNVQTFSVHMVRPEITKGLQQIVQHLTTNVYYEKPVAGSSSRDRSFLRRLPRSLVQLQFQGSNFGIELAGVDSGVSEDTRGVAFQVESWTAEYKIQKDASIETSTSKHRGSNNAASGDESFLKVSSSAASKKRKSDSTDGRRLAIHVKGLEGFVVEGIDSRELEPFLSLPRFEVAFSTSTDARGPVMHLSSHIKAVYLQYSLYRYYAVGVAHRVLREVFTSTTAAKPANLRNQMSHWHLANTERSTSHHPELMVLPEFSVIDLKVLLFQVKARMSADPPMMLQIYGIEAGRHRWVVPFMKSRMVRLYVEAPKVSSAWARVVSIKNSRVDLRESRRKIGKTFVDEKSIDLTADFIRLAVPHQLVIHKVFDNFVDATKATEQLHHRFQTGTDDYILNKPPERPKRVPRISIRTRAMMFELEDGLIDWKLGIIYRTGLIEQKQRLAREDAYRLKIKKLEEHNRRRGSSRYRTQSTHANHRGRSKPPELHTTRERSKSEHPRPRRSSPSSSGHRGRQMRYDPESTCGLTGAAQISAQEGWTKLQIYHSQSWRKRINMAMHYQKSAMREIRSMFWGNDELPDNIEESERILAMADRPGLMSTLISDLHVVVDKPSFPLEEYSRFLNRVGKGMPHDMKYSLLIPMSLQINMGEARVTLRDYPLPLLHVPAIKPGQSPRLPSWSLKTDFVIAEEYRDTESIRHVRVEVIPPEKITFPVQVKKGFAIDVRRTVSPTKTYSDVEIAINTGNPTSITWGTSYQPAIQDMMQIIEGFTKPQVDPSDRTGFWDKIRLAVHSRVNVAWKGDGDVHLKLKGMLLSSYSRYSCLHAARVS